MKKSSYSRRLEFRKIFDGVPKIGLILIILGYLNIYFYYDYFGLTIYQYLETSEIIFSFSTIIKTGYYLLVYILVLEMSSFLRIYDINRMITRNLTGNETNDQESPTKVQRNLDKTKNSDSKWLKEKFKAIIIVIIGYFSLMTMGSIIGPFLAKLRIDSDAGQRLFEVAIICFLFVAYIFLPIKFVKNSKYLLVLTMIILFVYVRTNTSYNLVMDKNPKYSAKILLKDGGYRSSNDTIVYIGGVRQYHFFHNIKSNENIIIPVSTIMEIQVKELRGGL